MHGDGIAGPPPRSGSLRRRVGVDEMEVEAHPRRQSVYGPATPGSYGHLVYTLAQGLSIALDRSWLDVEEAKREFRSHLHVVQEDEVKQERIREQEAQIEELEEALTRAKAELIAGGNPTQSAAAAEERTAT